MPTALLPPPDRPFGRCATEPDYPDSVDALYAEWRKTLQNADAVRLYGLGRRIVDITLNGDIPRAWIGFPHLEVYFKAWARRNLGPVDTPNRR